MEALGPYWLRKILLPLPNLVVYEGLDARTGTPVLLLRGDLEGEALDWPGAVPPLERLEDALVLEWPPGAVPLVQYLGVADPGRLEAWTRCLLESLAQLEARGLRYAPRPELVLVKGRKVWLVGVGLKALEGEPALALLELARALAGEAWGRFPLRERLEALAQGRLGWAQALEEAEPAPKVQDPPPPEPERPSRKPLPVETPEEVRAEPPPPPEPPKRRVIRLEDAEEKPPFEPVEPVRRTFSLGLVLGILLLLVGLGGFWLLRPKGGREGPYLMEFRTDPPTEKAQVYLLEAPQGSKLLPGVLLLTAPGRAEFDRPGVYRLRIRAPGREPVDYLLEVPGPPLVIRLR